MATNTQQPVGFIDRGTNAMARALSKGTNSGPGMLAATKTPNSGANSGTGVPTVGQKPNSSYRGNNLNSNMLTNNSTELASRASTHRRTERATKGYLKNKPRKNATKASTRNEKQRKYLNSLIAKDIIQSCPKDKTIQEFVKETLDKVKSIYTSQGTANADAVHTMTCKLLDGSEFDKRKALLKDRNQQAIKMLKTKTINEVKNNQWDQSKENNIYSLYETFVNDIGYFIDFGRLDPKTFKERTDKNIIPLWAGLRAFAERYSKANVRYPGLLLYIMNQRKRQARRNELDLIVYTKRLLSGYYEQALRSSVKGTFTQGLASSLKVKMEAVDQKLNDAFNFTNKLISIITTLNELSKITIRMSKDSGSYTDSFTLANTAVGQLCTLLSDESTKVLIPTSLNMSSIQNIIDKERESKETVEVNNDILVETNNGLGSDYDDNNN